MKKLDEKSDWLHGDREKKALEQYRQTAKLLRDHPPSNDEARDSLDKYRLLKMEAAASNPFAVLRDAKWELLEIAAESANSKSNAGSVFKDKLLASLLRRGLSPEEAILKRAEVMVRRDKKLCRLDDAIEWLTKTQTALNEGNHLVRLANSATKRFERIAKLEQAANAFHRAASFAYYFGLDSMEFKARAEVGKHGRKREGKHNSPGFEPTQTAWRKWKAGQPGRGETLSWQWLLSTMHAAGSAEWDTKKDRVRFKIPREKWSRWITAASFRNDLTGWKKRFTV